MSQADGLAVLEERVHLPGRGTRVRLAAGARHLLGDALASVAPGARRAGWVVDGRVAQLWERAGGLAAPPGVELLRVVLPPGEACKEREVLAATQDVLLGLTREEPVVVVGGGAALDLGGLAAATCHRGHPWVAVPTTVLAMADASVGGKVAINHARGKNLLGTFHPPGEVLADLELLATLPVREAAAGWAEVRKAGFVGDAGLLELLAGGVPATAALEAAALQRAIAVKARLVEHDERDHGARRALNYGHTLGHALERAGLGLLHGEAVALGMLAALALAEARGVLAPGVRAREAAALARLGLPIALAQAPSRERVLALAGADKKRKAGRHVFVLPVGTHGVQVVEDVTEAELAAALAALAPAAR
ncbi:MAG: 3-dehydroquinate synthase family protein [Planctomycetia bacterium]